ncbi:hypothetical protein [Posidoniimonas corsicana]|nr:hypothetical protein [Posidoniimonas corsicana]
MNLDVKLGRWRAYPRHPWQFRFDDSNLNQPIRRAKQEENAGPQVAVDVRNLIEAEAARGQLTHEWHRASLTYEWRGEDDGGLLVRLRSAVDARQFGRRWSTVRVVGRHGASVALSGACVTDIPYARVVHPSHESLLQQLDAEQTSDDVANARINLGAHDAPSRKLALQAWRLAWPAAEDTAVPINAALVCKLAAETIEADRDDMVGNSVVADLLAGAILQWEDGLVGAFDTEIAPPADPYMR